MRINKLIGIFLLSSFVWMANIAFVEAATSQGNPVAMLQSIAKNMIQGLKANKATLKTKPGIVYNLAYKYVVPYADLSEMSKRVLPPNIWNNATPSQRMQFQKEFTTLLIRTYASALTSYEDQTIEFYPVRGGYAGARTVVINSEISGSNIQPIRVSYRLLRVGSVWRLYDMSVEGVSLIQSFRSQFASILSQGSMDKLLGQMSRHNRR
ncbi:MAG: hypothetical protein A3F14_06250 [Gammaproteobacteria bacterium RIFCSPHIGHO2_12_FULL_43_28]|nr:MAG: hypothetical protein A3F14_06250 [Gammaproteobacteria bacterium RIFCSPHIGHO2_12_FULL_43_28]